MNKHLGVLINEFDLIGEGLNTVTEFNKLFYFAPIDEEDYSGLVTILEPSGAYTRELALQDSSGKQVILHDFNPVTRNGVECDVIKDDDVEDDWFRNME